MFTEPEKSGDVSDKIINCLGSIPSQLARYHKVSSADWVKEKFSIHLNLHINKSNLDDNSVGLEFVLSRDDDIEDEEKDLRYLTGHRLATISVI